MSVFLKIGFTIASIGWIIGVTCLITGLASPVLGFSITFAAISLFMIPDAIYYMWKNL